MSRAEGQTLPDIFDFQDYGSYLAAWKVAKGLSHRRIANLTGQRDDGVVANLIEKRRPFTRELQAAFIPVMGLEPQQARYLRCLVEAHDAALYEARCAEALVEAEKRRELKPTLKTRNNVKVAAVALTMAREEHQRARDAIYSMGMLHAAQTQRSAALQLASSILCATIEELGRCPDFRPDPTWIQGRLLTHYPLAAITEALETITRAGVHAGRDEPFVTPDVVPRDAVHHYYLAAHAELGRGIAELYLHDDAWRRAHLGAVTFALPASAVPRVQAMLDALREELVALDVKSTTEVRTEVYQCLLGFFPMTGDRTPAAR